MRRVLVFMAIAVVISGCGGSRGPGATLGPYTIEDLGVMDGDETQAKVSNSGDVFVVSLPYPPPTTQASTSQPHEDGAGQAVRLIGGGGGAFVWRAGVQIALGQSVPCGDINDQGQVVACRLDKSFLWDDGVETDMGSLCESRSITWVKGVNNAGQAVGKSWTGSAYHGFLWENGTMTDLGPELADALDINDAGQVLTNVSIWKDGTTTGLGSLGGDYTDAHAINNQGQVVGHASTIHVAHAFLWQHGQMKDLGTLGGEYSAALGINDLGQVVGSSRVDAGYTTHAFVWNGRMVDLNALLPPDSGWVLIEALDINDLGQIVGVGLLQGERHVFLLTP